MPNRNKKRFIAGAKCPSCGEFDSLMLYMQDNVERVECVKCDYQQSQADEKVTRQTRASENVIGVFKPE